MKNLSQMQKNKTQNKNKTEINKTKIKNYQSKTKTKNKTSQTKQILIDFRGLKWVTIQSTAKQLQITTSNHCHVHNVAFWQESCNDKKYIFWYKKQHKSGAARKKLERGYIYFSL